MYYPQEQSSFNFPTNTSKKSKFEGEDGWEVYYEDERQVLMKKTVGNVTQYRERNK